MGKGGFEGPLLSVQEVRGEFFPGRSERWIKDQAKAGAFGLNIARDGKGWLIPKQGVLEYCERHRVLVGGGDG